jgi:23S rRNA pseudouridine1911/1915/1917 synthase
MNKFDYKFIVDSSKAGLRLDVFLASELKDVTRARAQKLIDGGFALVGGRAAKSSHKVKSGDDISVEIPPPAVHDVTAEEIPLRILYEDGDIIVVDKPADMVVHPAHGNWRGTLVNALLAHCKDLSGVGGEMKPGIVHRLDRGTSGVIVAAKNDASHLNLSRQFKDREVKKVYKALVYGAVKGESGTIDLPIGRSVKDRKKFSARTRKGRAALTEWKVVKRFGSDLTLLEIRLHTGRTHQIRVHFAEAGHPLVGDALYGTRGQLKRISDEGRRRVAGSFERPALHAAKIGFTHPASGEWVEFEAPWPSDFRELLDNL